MSYSSERFEIERMSWEGRQLYPQVRRPFLKNPDKIQNPVKNKTAFVCDEEDQNNLMAQTELMSSEGCPNDPKGSGIADLNR